MNREIKYLIGELLDVIWRAVCLLAGFGILWAGGTVIVRHTPGFLKAIGWW